MTEHKDAHTGLVSPPPLDHWIDALLRVLAMLVFNVARRFTSRSQISSAECDGQRHRTPEAKPVLDIKKEPEAAATAAAAPDLPKALMVSNMAARSADMRPSNHDGPGSKAQRQ